MNAQTRWFPAVPGSLPEIRAFVRDLVGQSGLNGDDLRDVLLAVAEAADNAVQRAGASIVGVTWEPRDHAVLLTIEDDDRFSGQSLAAFLHAEGYDVTLVTSVVAAEQVLETLPAPAVVDLLTSHGEGTRFAAVARTSGVPVVAVSAIEPATHVADAYLPKPAHPLRVLAVVRDLLSPDS